MVVLTVYETLARCYALGRHLLDVIIILGFERNTDHLLPRENLSFLACFLAGCWKARWLRVHTQEATALLAVNLFKLLKFSFLSVFSDYSITIQWIIICRHSFRDCSEVWVTKVLEQCLAPSKHGLWTLRWGQNLHRAVVSECVMFDTPCLVK